MIQAWVGALLGSPWVETADCTMLMGPRKNWSHNGMYWREGKRVAQTSVSAGMHGGG